MEGLEDGYKATLASQDFKLFDTNKVLRLFFEFVAAFGYDTTKGMCMMEPLNYKGDVSIAAFYFAYFNSKKTHTHRRFACSLFRWFSSS